MVDVRQPPAGPVVTYRYTVTREQEWWVCEVPVLNIVLSIYDPGVIEEMLREEIATVTERDVRLVELHR